jgi:MOSC domain
MREVSLQELEPGLTGERAAFVACLATILELPPAELPVSGEVDERPPGPLLSRWLARLGLGLVPIRQPEVFTWPGPWLARARDGAGSARPVVMYGVPSGVVFDPLGGAAWPDEPGEEHDWVEEGFVVGAGDIALARPPRAAAPADTGTVISIHVADTAGTSARALRTGRLRAGKGIEGDRHVTGSGTFPSGLPGSALTLIEQRVCQELGLSADEHRRNVVVDGLELNELVGHEFMIGGVRCRGMRLCEPCTVIQRYAGRPILRPLVHRGGLRADILTDGDIQVGDSVVAV